MESEDSNPTGNLRQPFLDLAVDSWRFGKLFLRVLDKLDPTEASRYANQLRYFHKRLADSLELAGLWVVSLEGQPYDVGMAASPLNIEDFATDDVLIVEQMVEPLLMGHHGVVKPGTVLLKRVD